MRKTGHCQPCSAVLAIEWQEPSAMQTRLLGNKSPAASTSTRSWYDQGFPCPIGSLNKCFSYNFLPPVFYIAEIISVTSDDYLQQRTLSVWKTGLCRQASAVLSIEWQDPLCCQTQLLGNKSLTSRTSTRSWYEQGFSIGRKWTPFPLEFSQFQPRYPTITYSALWQNVIFHSDRILCRRQCHPTQRIRVQTSLGSRRVID